MSCTFNEDEYRNQLLNKYLDTRYEIVSNCCGEEMDNDTDICPKCKEHCEVIGLDEYENDEYENAMLDKADMERELEREENG